MHEHRCNADGCESQGYSWHGYCAKHYLRWKRHGDTNSLTPQRGMSEEDRFWRKVDKNAPLPEYAPNLGQCWLWLGAKKGGGYGAWAGSSAHRYSYALAKGPVPDGMQLDHLCRVRNCVRPDHLEAVTGRDNLLRSPLAPAAINAAKTHCPQGHPYDASNTYRGPDGNSNHRACRTCLGLRLADG